MCVFCFKNMKEMPFWRLLKLNKISENTKKTSFLKSFVKKKVFLRNKVKLQQKIKAGIIVIY